MSLDDVIKNAPDGAHVLSDIGKNFDIESVKVLISLLGGRKVHIPKSEDFEIFLKREIRNIDIKNKFNGRNYKDLEKEFGLGESQLRRILHGKRKERARIKHGSSIKIETELYEELNKIRKSVGNPSSYKFISYILRYVLTSDIITEIVESYTTHMRCNKDAPKSSDN